MHDFRKGEIAMEKKQKLISSLNLLYVQSRQMLDRETKYKRTVSLMQARNAESLVLNEKKNERILPCQQTNLKSDCTKMGSSPTTINKQTDELLILTKLT